MKSRTELGPAVLLVTLWACAVILRFESAVSGDTWFCLFFGRDILERGLPHTNDATLIAAGTWWIDAQWLAHVTWNRLFSFGGFELCMVLESFFEGLGLAIAASAARKTGASSMRIAMGVMLGLCLLPTYSVMRAQTFIWPLLGFTFWLVVEELSTSRPGDPHNQRLWLGVPMLVLWTNLHGSAILGAGLLGLSALITLIRRRHERRIATERVAMGLSFMAATLVSPYWLPPYWMKMTTDAGPFIEWLVPTFATEPVHVSLVALVGVGIVYTWKTLRREYAIYLAIVAFISMLGMRYGLILSFGLVVFGPSMLDIVLGPRRNVPRRARTIAMIASGLYLASVVVALIRVPPVLAEQWPREALEIPYDGGNVLADEQRGDWLLFYRPDLRNKVLFDARSEVASYEDWVRFIRIEEGDIELIDEFPDVRWVMLLDENQPRALRESRDWDEVYRNAQIAVWRRKR